MSEDKFRSEMSYLAALPSQRISGKKGLLSEEEYAVIDTNLRAEFLAVFGYIIIGKRLDIIGFQSDI